MKVLVDTSVWIEFFNPRPSLPPSTLELLIQEGRVVTCLPVKAEILSGLMDSRYRNYIQSSFEAMEAVDPDWNSWTTWEWTVEFSARARRARSPMPGLVDRMILASCIHGDASLWTLDRKLERLALALGYPLFFPEK